MGNRSFFSSGPHLQCVSAIQNLNNWPFKTFPKASYCVLPSSPAFFFILLKFCDLRETEQTFRNLQHFSFALTFPLISFTIFWGASGEVAS